MKGKTLLCLALVASMLLSVFMIGSVGAQSTTVGVEPSSIVDPGLGTGSTFTVEIWIRQVEDLAGFEFKLGYDTTVLTATLIEYGDIFGATYFPLISEINDTEGYLYYGIMEMFGEPGFYGDGRATIITFSVDSVGASALDLYVTELRPSSLPPEPIPHTALDGYFRNVAEVHDVAVTNVTAYPTEAEAGDPVTVNVTVRNEGTESENFNVIVYADIFAYDPVYPDIVLVGDEITVGTQTVTDLANGTSKTLTFTWDTTGCRHHYTISANASTVPDETDTDDNLLIDDKVAVQAHNIAITNVVPSPTEVNVGDNVTINVTATNEGDLSETFDVTVYYDDDPIETQTVTDLASGAEITLTFTWDTAGVEEDTYTIKAETSAVPGDVDTADNTFIDGTVRVGGAPAPNILPYAAAGIVIIIAAAIAIYIIKFRK